jgi:hypothetical protein
MPEPRRPRGPHPEDAALFAPPRLADLRRATADLGWLLERGYAPDAALALVGDHLQLARRQRIAVRRSAAGPRRVASRLAARVEGAGRTIVVDGFNVLVTLEAALSGGVLLRGADGLLRDLASVHGDYRTVDVTEEALALAAAALRGAAGVTWVFDRPVSNSGRVAMSVRALGFEAVLADAADAACVARAGAGAVLASADAPLLDRVDAALDLTGPIVAAMPAAWVVALG